jgi:CRISPR/Cas system-associated exonuclease Cas4 (RecB family)
MLPKSSKPIGALSPSRLDRLSCPARVAFEQAGTGWSKPSAAAVLGSTVHRAIAHLIHSELPDQAWEHACDDLNAQGQDPRSLPGARRAAIRFRRQSSTVLQTIEDAHPAEAPVVEVTLRSSDGQLEGTPDLVLVTESGLVVIDHKTSTVAEDGVARPAYEQQVRIYAGLAAAQYGRPVIRGILISTRQGVVDVDVTPDLVEAALNDARQARSAYNDRVPGLQPAHASPERCRWCPYRARCDGFWDSVDVSWRDEVGECTRARVIGSPEVAADGRAALSIQSTGGPMSLHEQLTLAEVPEINVAGLADGDAIAMTGLRKRDASPQVVYWVERSSLWREGDST